jgi:hypothetical protein
MYVQVGVDPQDHFTGSSRALAGSDAHVYPLSRRYAQYLARGRGERTLL